MLAPKGPKRQKNQAAEKPKTVNSVEEILAHGDSINITAARVSDKPGRIRITGATIIDHKTADDDRLEFRYVPELGLEPLTPASRRRSLVGQGAECTAGPRAQVAFGAIAMGISGTGSKRMRPKRFTVPCERSLEKSKLSLANAPDGRVISRPAMSAFSVAIGG